MPVRVRCSECDKTLNAPDAARGKAIKCSGCGARVRVPAGKRKKAAKRPVKRAADDDEFLGGVNLRHAEDRNTRLCMKCAAEVDEEDIECPNCGVNLETGVLSDKQRKLRARKGPDPDEFYGAVWGDSWSFMLANWKLALKTALISIVLGTMSLAAVHTQVWCVGREIVHRTEKYAERFAIDKSPNKPDPPSAAEIRVEAQFSPPVLFWGGISMLTVLGNVGWYWFVAGKVIACTMNRKPELGKVKADLFANFALGIKGYFWPMVLILPFFFFPPIWLLPFVSVPIAMIHMNQRYSYKAYLPWDMLRIFFKTAAPSLYVFMITIVLNLAVIVAIVVVGIVMPDQVYKFILDSLVDFRDWLNDLTFGMDEGFGRYLVLEFPCAVLIFFAFLTPFALVSCFPTIFIFRTYGLFGLYFKPELELENQKTANVPCGFWPRWLAYLIDSVVLSCVLGAAYVLVFAVIALSYKLGIASEGVYEAMFPYSTEFTQGGLTLRGILSFASFVFICIYFVRAEGGIGQASVGKRAVGLVVTDMKGRQISTRNALGRFFGKILSGIPLYAGFITAAFTEKKQAWHDSMAKTLVVWQGDETRS